MSDKMIIIPILLVVFFVAPLMFSWVRQGWRDIWFEQRMIDAKRRYRVHWVPKNLAWRHQTGLGFMDTTDEERNQFVERVLQLLRGDYHWMVDHHKLSDQNIFEWLAADKQLTEKYAYGGREILTVINESRFDIKNEDY